jgi:Protein of unknown function (DUF2752)
VDDARRLALLAVVAARVMPRRLTDAGPTICLFRRVTGRPCPTCGMTRSWSAATRLDLRESIGWHPLGLPTLLGALLVAGGVVRPSLDEPEGRRWAAVGTAVWVAVALRRFARPPRRFAD